MCNVGAFMQEYLFGTWMSSAAGLQFQNTPQAADGLLSLIIVCNPAGENGSVPSAKADRLQRA